ncbi:16S rRNA (guanine(527)-N(7))-methyltransferase RsmG [Cereibacter sphaeroides]|nr:16S rRNA (guanine(527)-N(7))-methyltransferase RsmG [Cereibacter sphaeroides]
MSRRDDVALILGRDVSRETLDRLDAYLEALLRWSSKINLIAKATHGDAWRRHILDSVQLSTHLVGDVRSICDIGSGGGLPGMVTACIAAEFWPGADLTLIESDARKAAFLTTVARDLGLKVSVKRARIEACDPVNARYVSARALAPMPLLLHYCARHMAADGICLLPKGRNWRLELEEAREAWHFDADVEPSKLDPDSVIAVVRNLQAVEEPR